MLEASAEVLIHFIKAFEHYEKNQSRLAQALIVRTRSEPSNPCKKANPGRRFTRHCVNSTFIGGFLPAAYSTLAISIGRHSAVSAISCRAAGRFGWLLKLADIALRQIPHQPVDPA
jgi:hypothetical protein